MLYNQSLAMTTRLDQIVTAIRRQFPKSLSSGELREIEQKAFGHAPRGFRHRLMVKAEEGISVIAELKKASPSKGLIRADFDVEVLARELESAGAAALSVLTDEPFFQGSLLNLRTASSTTQLPCLRKDFIVDEFQILEARANRADAILLIVAALSQKELLNLAAKARTLELDVLCEVHDRQELTRALDAGCEMIGVNNRDLRTFEVSLDTAIKLAEHIPGDRVRVAESGIHSAADLVRLRSAGYHAFLIGGSLMSAKSPGDALKKLLQEANSVHSQN